MSHIHSVHDSNAHFKINPVTRVIECLGKEKPRIMKGDHNSERITFELPRTVDGHDMITCNRIAVHALNIDAVTEETNPAPPYYVDDIRPSSDDDSVALCSWVISRNCTQLVGPLYFRVSFECISNPESGEVDYTWSTDIYKGLAVGDGIRCDDYDPEEYNDILAQWQLIITEAAVSAAVASAADAQAKAEAAQLKAEAAQTGAEQAQTSAAASAQAAADSARTAAGSAGAASTHEANALNAVKQAQDATGRAETAATNAEGNLAGARSAEANAQKYQAEANNQAKAADASRATAEQAKADAVSAAARAEQAQTKAEAARTAADQSAQAAADSARTATGSAQAAAASAAEAVIKTQQALERAKASGEFDGEKGDMPFVFSSSFAVGSADIGFDYYIPLETINTSQKEVAVGDLVLSQQGKIYRVLNGVNIAGLVRSELLAVLKGDPGYTPQKNVDYFDGKDYVLTEADKTEIAEQAAALVDVPGGGGISSWEDMPAPMPHKFLPEGVPYVETEEVSLNFTFDGDPTGKETINMGGPLAVKVSNAVIPMDDLMGATVTMSDGSVMEVSGDLVFDVFGDGSIIGNDGIFAVQRNCVVEGIAFTAGLYFIYMEADGFTMYTQSLVKEGATVSAVKTVHKLDSRCLPDNIGGNGGVLLVTLDVSSMTADKTADEICQAVQTGKTVLLYSGNQIATCIGCMPGMGAFFMLPSVSSVGENGVSNITGIVGSNIVCVKHDGSILIK